MERRALVVDSSFIFRRTINKILGEMTFEVEVIEASDGEGALSLREYLKDRPVDILTTDMFLDGMVDGEKVIEEFKNQFPGIRVIVICGLPSLFETYEGLEQRAKAAGCDGFLRKPFDPFVLREEVKRLFGE